jgi:hypothetical protein
MKNRVYNGTIGKIIRTFGFLLILISSAYLAINYVSFYDSYVGLAQLAPYANQALDFIATLPVALFEYVGLAFFAGFIMLIWAIRKGLIVRVVLTVGLAFLMIHTFIAGNSPIEIVGFFDFPTWLDGLQSSIVPTYISILDISEYVIGGVAIGVPIFLWFTFANKKPNRFSIMMLRIGSTTLFLGAAMVIVANQFVVAMLTNALYMQVVISLLTLSYLLFVLGALFGFLGFSRK